MCHHQHVDFSEIKLETGVIMASLAYDGLYTYNSIYFDCGRYWPIFFEFSRTKGDPDGSEQVAQMITAIEMMPGLANWMSLRQPQQYIYNYTDFLERVLLYLNTVSQATYFSDQMLRRSTA